MSGWWFTACWGFTCQWFHVRRGWGCRSCIPRQLGSWLVGWNIEFFSSMFHIGWNHGPWHWHRGETGTGSPEVHPRQCLKTCGRCGVFGWPKRDVDFPKQSVGWVTNHNGNSAIESTSEGGCHAEPNQEVTNDRMLSIKHPDLINQECCCETR